LIWFYLCSVWVWNLFSRHNWRNWVESRVLSTLCGPWTK
jgi:hypothetical protein